MSENISAAISVNGEIVMKQPLIKSMRVVKKETLKLISDWVSRTSDHQMVNFLAPKFPSFYLYFTLHGIYITCDFFLPGTGKLYTTVTGRCLARLSKDKCSLC